MTTPYYEITITDKTTEHSMSFRIFSHYTLITGEYSGEGKSKFLQYLADGRATSTVEISIGNKGGISGITIATLGNITELVKLPGRYIIFVDEENMLRYAYAREINNCNHLIVAISRGNPFHLDAPLQALYQLSEPSTNRFIIKPVESLPIYQGQKISTVVTEAAPNKSEHEMLSKFGINATPASGRDRVASILLRQNGATLVLADLGNISKAYKILLKRSKQKEVYFYAYSCFEELLLVSPYIQGSSYLDSDNVFRYLTPESYIQTVLEVLTYKTDFEYKRNPYRVSEKYFQADTLLDSDIGKLLKILIHLEADTPATK